MIDEKFVILAAAIILLGDLSYLYLTIKGKVKPNKVTWFLWALAPFVAFAGELDQGIGISSLMTLSVGIIPALIFLASFLNKKSYWKITSLDLACGALALMGLLLWGLTRVGNLAILFAIVSDALAAVPTAVKAYKAPESENYLVYLFNGIGGFITLLAIVKWNFANYAFPAYLLIMATALFLLIKFKLGKKDSICLSCRR